MKVIIMRHGEAEMFASSDAERQLTPNGVDKNLAAADQLLAQGIVNIDKVLVSHTFVHNKLGIILVTNLTLEVLKPLMTLPLMGMQMMCLSMCVPLLMSRRSTVSCLFPIYRSLAI